MSELERKPHHPYRSVRLPEGRRAGPIDGPVAQHSILASAVLGSGGVAYASEQWSFVYFLLGGVCSVWMLWAVPYAVYLACRGRWSWLSTRRHVAVSIVWMLAIGAACCATVRAEGRREDQALQALDALVRTTVQAARRYRADHGHYPETPGALVPRYLPRVPVVEPPIGDGLTCPIEVGVWNGVPTLWIPGRDPMLGTCIHRRGIGFDLSTGRALPR